MRKWVFLFFILNFILLIVFIADLPREAFSLSLIHSTLMAFALILLSFWVWRDNVEIDKLYELIDILRKKQKNQEREKLKKEAKEEKP